MKNTVFGMCLVLLSGCSTMSDMGERVNAEIDAYLAQREKKDFVEVVYPAELRQYQGDRQDTSNPSYWQNDSYGNADYQADE